MVPRQKGLIINISSAGGIVYLFTPAYGAGKEAVSRKSLTDSKVFAVQRNPGKSGNLKKYFLVPRKSGKFYNRLRFRYNLFDATHLHNINSCKMS